PGRQPRGGPFGDKDVVGRRQLRGLQAIEDELGLDHRLAPRPGRPLRARAKNTTTACATTADRPRPAAPAWPRTRPMSGTGSLTVNTPVGAGTGTCPDLPAR